MAVKKAARKTAGRSAKKSVRKTVKKATKKTARKTAKKTVKKAARKSVKKAVRKAAARPAAPSIPAGPVCNVTPELGPHTFPADGGTFFVLVSYPSGPDACPYTTKPSVRWIKANPRISEFDVILAPNPSRVMRRGVVWVQGQWNPTRHKVVIQQSGA